MVGALPLRDQQEGRYGELGFPRVLGVALLPIAVGASRPSAWLRASDVPQASAWLPLCQSPADLAGATGRIDRVKI